MPPERFSIGPDAPESALISGIAQLTLLQKSECSFWLAADETGEPEGTYMVVCVLGPKAIADLRTAMEVLMLKWEAEDADQGN